MTPCPEHPYSPYTHLGCVMCEGAKLDTGRRRRLLEDVEEPPHVIDKHEVPLLLGDRARPTAHETVLARMKYGT